MFAMKYKTIALGIVAVHLAAFAATSAQAASYTYDFVHYIDVIGGGAKDGSGGEKAILGDFSLSDTTSSKSLTITAHGTNVDSALGGISEKPVAYFDHGGAGIGVCQDYYTSNLQCKIASDDNVTGPLQYQGPAEILSLAFDESLQIDGLLFRNEGHTATFQSGRIKIAVSDGVGTISDAAYTSYALQTSLAGSLLGAGLVDLSSFNLTSGDFVHMMFDNQQFYLSGLEVTAIPLPPAVILFGSALLGLGALRRRRMKKAA